MSVTTGILDLFIVPLFLLYISVSAVFTTVFNSPSFNSAYWNLIVIFFLNIAYNVTLFAGIT